MNWKELNQLSPLNDIINASQSKPVLIYKHSTRCSISSVVKNRLESGKLPEDFEYYYLDLIRHRDISNVIAEEFKVEHESPQVLIIKNGKAVYHSSHLGINPSIVSEQLEKEV